jgi:hypothetical protein
VRTSPRSPRPLCPRSPLPLTLALVCASLLGACSDDSSASNATDAATDVRDTGRDSSSDAPSGACDPAADGCGPGLVCDPGRLDCVARCAGDRDCAPIERCEVASGLCVDRTPCTDSGPCLSTEACDTCLGVCVDSPGGAFCLEDVNCPDFDQFCDPCLSQCRPRGAFCEECRADEECGDVADVCLTDTRGLRFCGAACGVGRPPCPRGAACDPALHQCVPLSGDCTRLVQCDADGDCRGAQICSLAGVCVDGCTGDAACPSPDVCNGGRCEPRCTTEAQCDPGEECESGRCRVPGSCVTSWDCPAAEMHCDRLAGTCVEGCEVDDDCRTFSAVCREGACVPRGCRGNYSCAFGQVCDLASGQCAEPSEPHCATCNGDDLDSCGTGNICANLQDAEGNPQGAFCWLACAPDPDNACPQGYACTDVEIQQQGGATQTRRVCARACYRNPV